MTFISDVLCVSRLCVLNACLAKAKQLVLNEYTKVGTGCFNLNCEANYRPKGAFADRAEEGISLLLFAFLSIFSLCFCYYLHHNRVIR